MIKYLILLMFLAGCSPKAVDSCQFKTTIYGETVKHKSLPVVIYVDESFPSDYYDELTSAVKEINRDRLYIVIYTATTGKTYNYINEIILQKSWPDNNKQTQGITSLWYGSSGRIQETDIQVNVDDYEYSSGIYSFKTLILHELLHGLGMIHQEDDSNGILYPYLAARQVRGMTEREYKNLECAYGK